MSIKDKFILLLYSISLLCMCGCSLKAPELSKSNLLQDLNYLENAVRAGHPITLNKSWTNDLEAFITKLNSQSPDNLTPYEYENYIRQALSIIGCSHTTIKESPLRNMYLKEMGERKYMPIRFFADSSGLYMIDIVAEIQSKPIRLPAKVHSINQLNAQEIVNKLLVYQPADGPQNTMGYSVINKYSEILIPRLFIGTDTFAIQYEESHGAMAELNIEAAKDYRPTSFQYFRPSATSLVLDNSVDLYLLNHNSVYLRIETLDYDDYKHTNSSLFEYIISKNIENLVLDLRGNTGGQPKIALDFLSYVLKDTLSQRDIRPGGDVSPYLTSRLKLAGVWFWDKVTKHEQTAYGKEYITNQTFPKQQQYDKNIYILTDGFTASSACTLAAYLKHKAGAVSIGQETGGGETGCNANSFQTLKLSKSGVKINFPLFRFNHQLSLPDNHRGIVPTYPISYDAQSYMMNIDLEMEKVLEIIN